MKKKRLVVSLPMVFLAIHTHALFVTVLITDQPYPLPLVAAIITMMILVHGISEIESETKGR